MNCEKNTTFPGHPVLPRPAYHNDLFFAMRGAGSSFAIATGIVPTSIIAAGIIAIDIIATCIIIEQVYNCRRYHCHGTSIIGTDINVFSGVEP